MRTLGIVPARGGSKRLPRKNLRTLGGRPLLSWAIETALAAERLDRVVVSSEDPEILAVARKHRDDLPLERPRDLAGDLSPAIGYVRHALSALEDAGDAPYDAVAILQPTSPLTLPDDVDATLALLERTGADSAVTAVRVEHALHPAKLKRLDGDRLVSYVEEERGRMASHELPEVYVRNGAVYATRRRAIEAGTIVGPDCRAHVMPRERSVDVNDELDLAFAQFLLARRS